MSRKGLIACIWISVLAVLAAACIADFFGQFGIGTRFGAFDYHIKFCSGCLFIGQYDSNRMVQGLFWRSSRLPVPEMGDLTYYGPQTARLRFTNLRPGQWSLEVPIFLLITAIIPVVVGSFAGFRFPLWQYFAFTALVALALGWSLR